MNARLVPDEPSAIDEISGAHQHIAKTIATLIKQSPGGKFIKLEGIIWEERKLHYKY